MIEVPLTLDGARRTNPLPEPLRSPARPALQVASALERVRRAPTILEAMRTVAGLLGTVDASIAAGTPAATLLPPVLEAIDDPADTLTAIAAVHALARIPGAAAEAELADMLVAGGPAFEQHAAWAVAGREPGMELATQLSDTIARGGLSGMHAQRALASWSQSDGMTVLVSLGASLSRVTSAEARRRLTETVGLVPGRAARLALERIAHDPAEAVDIRTAAVLAFAERTNERLPSSIAGLRRADDELAVATRTTMALRRLARRGPRSTSDSGGGVRIAQVHLGRTGGLATMLPRLGDALAARARISEVTTVVRATSSEEAGTTRRRGHRLERLALEPGAGESFASGWPSLVPIARAIRGALLAGARPDLVHLRMADPGSLAGALVARELGTPVVFTLAADPQRQIAAAEAAGSVDRRTFALRDGGEAWWFRSDLVDRLARQARELVLFPHAGPTADLESLVGVDLSSGAPRHTVIAEGIDTTPIRKASDAIARAATAPPVLMSLQGAIGRLPRHRHGLPLVVSTGRLHPVKGMARLVEAFADDRLGARANLVIIGGDLADPEPVEAAELTRIRRALAERPGLAERVVLLGQRSNEDVAQVLAAAVSGWGSLIGAGGAYACASEKEEFGLALIEALATGLPVVAPNAGGPRSYVAAGRTGRLVDTTDQAALVSAIVSTLDLALEPETASRARASVEARYTLTRMARDLTAVYRVAAGARSLGRMPVGGNEVAA